MSEPVAEWPQKTNPSMMTVEDVARRLNVSDSFVYGQIATGRMRHHRLGKGQGGIRVSEEQLAEFLRLTERGGFEEEPKDVKKTNPKGPKPTFTFLNPPS